MSNLGFVIIDSSDPLYGSPVFYTVATNRATAYVTIQPTNVYYPASVADVTQTTLFLSGTGVLQGDLPLSVVGDNFFKINILVDGTISTYDLTITNPAPTAPCFPKGTRIQTASGYKAVETLAQNELVLTADGRPVPVKIYGKHLPVTTSATAPYKVPKGTFGLQNDLVLSPDHAFQIRKGLWMLPKRAALLSDRVEQVGVGEPVTYYHLECPSYLRDNLVVDGAVVESYGGKAKSPYTYSESLKGYTRSNPIKNITKA